MTGTYRLVFRGEVLEGQHEAVVKQRLGVVLKIDGERLDALFTGKAVTVRKSADADTAAKFQVAFKRAGARLRVVPIDPLPVPDAPAPQAAGAANVPGFNLAPVGTPLHDASTAPAPAPVDTSHLTLAAPGTDLSEPRQVEVVALDLSHLRVAELGADLHDEVPEPDVAVVAAPSWGIAKVGTTLAPPKPPVKPTLDIDAIDFDVAPPGTRLAAESNEPPPPAPDTSHLHLQ
jgi:hypothetical protein